LKPRSKVKSLGTIIVIVLGRHHIVAGVILQTVATIAAVGTRLRAGDIALVMMMGGTAVVRRPRVIITMMIHGITVVIGPLLVVARVDRRSMTRIHLLAAVMKILMALLRRAAIPRIHIRRMGILVVGSGEALLREAMNTIRLGVIGDFSFLI
jgi:hypothetical protein